jgi:hypothetical protein
MTDNLTDIDPIDDTSQAFEALRGEVSLARRAVEGLTAARERLPDYSVTLGEIIQVLNKVAGAVERVERSPVVRLSPVAWATEINKASVDARAEDHALLRGTCETLSRSIGRLDGIIERGQAADRQWRRLAWTGGASAIAGMLLMSVLPGVIARSLPSNWHVPEWMAARTMAMDEQHAAARLLEVSRVKDQAEPIIEVDEHARRRAREGQ